jgi:hypothetical protein
MSKFYFIGSSHAKRMGAEFQEQNKNLTVMNFGRSGAIYENLFWPDFSKINEKDFIFIQFLGNDIFPKQFVKFEKSEGKKCFHLTKFSPIPLNVLEEKLIHLKNKLSNCKAKIILIDIFLRHLNCCAKHRDSRILAHQLKINKIIKQVLNGSNITVVDHKKLIWIRSEKLKNIRFYEKLFVDSVHFYKKYYFQISKSLKSRFVDKCYGMPAGSGKSALTSKL